jgi:hypothetical protein
VGVTLVLASQNPVLVRCQLLAMPPSPVEFCLYCWSQGPRTSLYPVTSARGQTAAFSPHWTFTGDFWK